ncbi:hypothetical protein B0H19DRAFT_1068354 [Mycena capillaripes]|nr:hypothetical protein B0H19DRAFT_1068354 [Mycena capillaripes]
MPALRLGFLAFVIVGAVQAQVAVSPSKPSPPASTTSFPKQVIGQTPNSLFLENIAVRASSELLLTSVASSTLFTFNPTAINGTFDPIYTFPNANGLTGIAEYRPGVFAVVAAILNLTTRRWAPGSIVIWTVDFNMPTPTVDGRTGKSRVAIQDVSMLPGAPAPAIGINGIHIRDAHLYFVNSQQQIFARVPLAVKGGNITAAGVVETLAAVEPVGQNPDDFALDCEGRARVAVHPGALALFSPPASGRGNWTQVTAAGNDNGTDTGRVRAILVTSLLRLSSRNLVTLMGIRESLFSGDYSAHHGVMGIDSVPLELSIKVTKLRKIKRSNEVTKVTTTHTGLIQPTSVAFGRGSEIQEKMLYVTTGAGQLVAVDTGG